jgi:hypothetical protein
MHIYGDWGLPDCIISDQDSKFWAGFWKRLFALANTRLAFTTAYHSSANGQSERTNQTYIQALRCAIRGRYD